MRESLASETERQRDRETERQRDRETERQRDRETERQKGGVTERRRTKKVLHRAPLNGITSNVGKLVNNR